MGIHVGEVRMMLLLERQCRAQTQSLDHRKLLPAHPELREMMPQHYEGLGAEQCNIVHQKVTYQ
jgi:hypothetical protein